MLATGCANMGAAPPVARAPLVSVDEIGADQAMVALMTQWPGHFHLALSSLTGSRVQRETVLSAKPGEILGWALTDLPMDSDLRLTWRLEGLDGISHGGFHEFATTPSAHRAVPVRFSFGGDLGGQNACRDARLGYPVFDAMARYKPDFFVALGDMIYADDVCGNTGQYGNTQVPGGFTASATPADFAAHWRYQLEDAALAGFRARVGWYTTWDDHEVLNDFDPTRDYRPGAPDTRLLAHGRAALSAYGAVPRDRVYRSVRWGRHLELFVLDTRSYRDANSRPDNGAVPKTMLGRAQRDWLIASVAASTATWKVLVSSVPLSIPTGNAQPGARDGWANGDSDTGYERELIAILASLDEAGVQNLAVISADVHFASVFRYPMGNGGDFDEFVVGPLNAGIYPNPSVDPSLRPQRLFFYGPDAPVSDFYEAMTWFNFGLIDIAVDGALRARIINAHGDEVFELRRTPSRRDSPQRSD